MWNSINAANVVIKNIFPFNTNRIIYVMFCKPIAWAQIHTNTFLVFQMFDRFSKKFQMKPLFIRRILYNSIEFHVAPPSCLETHLSAYSGWKSRSRIFLYIFACLLQANRSSHVRDFFMHSIASLYFF